MAAKNISSKLRFVGFCGIDDTISPELLILVSQKYPFIEWGVLFRSDLEGTPRYATTGFLNRLSNLRKEHNSKIHLAGHFCNDRCREILAGDFTFARFIHEQWGFNRIQINATAANGVNADPSFFPSYAENIIKAATELSTIEFIFQLNTETQPIWDIIVKTVPPNISVLHDASCGLGIAIQELPAPDLYGKVPCGYAGGIGPATIANILASVDNAVTADNASKPVWIDMESSLRTLTFKDSKKRDEVVDIFDINKCMACVDVAAQQYGMK